MRSTLLVDDFYLGEHTNLYLGDSNIPPAESLFIIQYKGMTEAFEHCLLALRLQLFQLAFKILSQTKFKMLLKSCR